MMPFGKAALQQCSVAGVAHGREGGEEKMMRCSMVEVVFIIIYCYLIASRVIFYH